MHSESLRFSLYHKALRILCAVFTCILLFDSGLLFPGSEAVSIHTQNYLASAVGVQVGVAPNELNVLTARITELEQELVTKDREIAVTLSAGATEGSTMPTSTIVLSIILFILLVLIVLNYALDYVRLKQQSEQGRQLQQA
jgi:hypothetical protein